MVLSTLPAVAMDTAELSDAAGKTIPHCRWGIGWLSPCQILSFLNNTKNRRDVFFMFILNALICEMLKTTSLSVLLYMSYIMTSPPYITYRQ